jgi:hypothetical protein
MSPDVCWAMSFAAVPMSSTYPRIVIITGAGAGTVTLLAGHRKGQGQDRTAAFQAGR